MKRVYRQTQGQSREAARHGGIASSQRAGDMALARSNPTFFFVVGGKIVFASPKARKIRDLLRREP